MTLWEELRMVLILLAVAGTAGIAARLLFRSKLSRLRRFLKGSSQHIRWPHYAVVAAFFFLYAALAWHWRCPVLAALFACLGFLQLLAMGLSIRRHRSQWSIKTLLRITTLVAVSCSLLSWQGWPMVTLLMTLLGGAALWVSLAALFRWWVFTSLNESEDNDDGTSS